MADTQGMLPFPPQLVHKSTQLCRARWKADSVIEARIVAIIASRISPDDHEALTFDIPASDLLRENYGGADLDDLRAAAKKVIGRHVTLENDDEWVIVPLVSKCRYFKKTRIFRVTIDPEIRPHFLWFKETVLKFTKYNLLEFMALPSVYSQRIFELLQSWRSEPEFTRAIDWLHDWLDTPKSFRADFKAFRQKVLEKAQKHIHFHTPLRFAWESVKDGRKVTAIRFIFSGRRVAESKLEAARIAGAKVVAASMRRTAAYKEAQSCAKDKKGLCTARDRLKRVCDICEEWGFLRQYAPEAEHSETQTSQQGQRVLTPFES